MGTIKDRNGRDLTEDEDIKKRWQEYTEELYKKKTLHDPDNHYGMIIHLKPETLNAKSSGHFNFMAAVTICSDFGAKENKVCQYFHCFPIYLQ